MGTSSGILTYLFRVFICVFVGIFWFRPWWVRNMQHIDTYANMYIYVSIDGYMYIYIYDGVSFTGVVRSKPKGLQGPNR